MSSSALSGAGPRTCSANLAISQFWTTSDSLSLLSCQVTWNNEDPTFSTIFNLSLKSPPPLISLVSLPSSKPPSPSPMSTMSPSPSHCHINMKPSVECSRTLWDTDCNWIELVIIQIRHTRLQISSEKRPFSGTGWDASGVPLSPARKNSARLSASFDWEVSGVGSTFNI